MTGYSPCLANLTKTNSADEKIWNNVKSGVYGSYWAGANACYLDKPDGIFTGTCAPNNTGPNMTCLIATERYNKGLIKAGVADLLCKLSAGDYSTKTMYLDENCNVVTQSDVNKMNVCSTYNVTIYFSSPISLVWDNASESSPTAVKFPLDPKNADKFVVWRASAATPLLVYDPQKTGKITKAEQLFGQHTFGKTWKDGFEALASLDKNGDGKITDDELKDLSLWFDNNQNGVSEAGEVIDLRAAGVTELYYKKDSDDTRTGAIVAIKGYRKVDKDGRIFDGSAIDWFSGLYDSKADAEAEIRNFKKADNDRLSSIRHGFSGLWAWEITQNVVSKDSVNTGGYLTFTESGD